MSAAPLDDLIGFLTASGGMHAWAMATAAVVAAAAAVVGSLLVVRRMSLLGDAISHGVLPGIVAAVLLGGRPGGGLATLAALAAAGLTVWLAELLRSKGGLAEDAAAGVVFTTMFALGVVVLSMAASRVDVDPGCVLYGLLELVPFDTMSIAGLELPRAFVTGCVVLVAVAAGLAVSWRAQLFTAFDPQAARAVGLPTGLVTASLLGATAVVTVAGFEAVGAVMVVAMLVAPAATAERWAHTLPGVIVLAVVIAVAASCGGYLLAWRLEANAAGMIATLLGGCYAAAVVFAPGGLAVRAAKGVWLGWRVACEDVLAVAWRAEEAGGVVPAGSGLRRRLAAWWLTRRGRIDGHGRLSAEGRREAEVVVRSHRLWEAWLGRHADLPLDHLHPPAEWVEHYLGVELRQRLERELRRETPAESGAVSDPHGRTIPPERTP